FLVCLFKFFFDVYNSVIVLFFFFFQAEDGIRDRTVTGVQTCALPILTGNVVFLAFAVAGAPGVSVARSLTSLGAFLIGAAAGGRSEERRVGKECRARG